FTVQSASPEFLCSCTQKSGEIDLHGKEKYFNYLNYLRSNSAILQSAFSPVFLKILLKKLIWKI
ncbi:MAG: hypothetical protein ACI4KR_09570, partial [Ruminiclostridium sp.]